ncbi:MAG: glycosyltransferase family 4 protein [Pseudomonadota bacterium]
MEASAVNVMRTCDALAREGHKVTVFARRNGTDDVAAVLRQYGVTGDVRLVLLGPPAPPRDLWIRKEDRFDRNFRYPLQVLQALRGMPAPDLIYGRHLYSMALASLFMPDIPMMFELHQVRSSGMGRLLERWLFQRPAFIGAAVISEALIADYRRLYAGLDRLELFLVRNGAEWPTGEVTPANLGGRPGVRKIGYVGSLFPGKGMETVAALARRLPEMDFHVVGGTATDIGEWRRRAPGAGNMHFHGFVESARVPAYLASMDVLLAPPRVQVNPMTGRGFGRWESPLKIFQYMAAGKPIIASDLPIVREILTDGSTALLAPAEDMDAWVGALRRLEDPALAQRLATSARTEVERRFSWRAKARAIEGVYRHRRPQIPASGSTLEDSA